MKHAIVIYELFPERTEVYLIPGDHLTDDDLQALHLSCGSYANASDQTPEVDAACERVADLVGNYVPIDIDKATPVNDAVVFITGFLL